MEIKVLAYQTQIETLAPAGELRIGPNWTCLVTPSNPGWFWGTFMVRDRRPKPAEMPHWEAEFDRLLADVPGINHRSFAWNSPQSEPSGLEEFTAAGYTLYQSATLVMDGPARGHPVNSNLEIRPLRSDSDWAAALRLQELVAGEKYFAGIPPFKKRQMEAYRMLCEQGRGEWWGAWPAENSPSDHLLADLGLFFTSRNTACLQQVETHPAHRRKGICRRLLQRVSERAFHQGQCKRLVAWAEADSPAQALYLNSGALIQENTVELTLTDRCRPHPASASAKK